MWKESTCKIWQFDPKKYSCDKSDMLFPIYLVWGEPMTMNEYLILVVGPARLHVNFHHEKLKTSKNKHINQKTQSINHQTQPIKFNHNHQGQSKLK